MRESARETQSAGAGKAQMCTFWIAGRLFGVDILDVKEINTEVEFCSIHHAGEEVRGYVNIRGQIHLVLDLRLLLGFEPEAVGPNSRVVIFKPHVGETFGVLVDKIGDIVDVVSDQIEERKTQQDDQLTGRDGRKSLIKGECKLDDYLLVILDAKRLLN